jgi:hypothetical protein
MAIITVPPIIGFGLLLNVAQPRENQPPTVNVRSSLIVNPPIKIYLPISIVLYVPKNH